MASFAGRYRPLQDGLRAVGRYLDGNGFRLVSLSVVDGGVFVTIAPEDFHNGGLSVFLDHDSLSGAVQIVVAERGQGNAPQSRDVFFPTAYEDFLRSLGALAAERQWEGLRLLRMGGIAVLHYGPSDRRGEIVLEQQDVESIINNALERRAFTTVSGQLEPAPRVPDSGSIGGLPEYAPPANQFPSSDWSSTDPKQR